MDQIYLALTLARDAVFFTFLFPVATTATLAIGVMVLLRVGAPNRRNWKHSYWFSATHLIFFAAAISVGVWFHRSPAMGPDPETLKLALALLRWIFYASLGSCIFWVWRMKGMRWWAVVGFSFVEMTILGALFVSVMLVSGNLP